MDTARTTAVVQQLGIDLKDWCHEDVVIRAAKRYILMFDIRRRMQDERADAWELVSTDREVLARGTSTSHEILVP